MGCESLLFNLIFYSLADFVCRIHIASCKNINTVIVLFNKLNLKILHLLNIEGFIENFRIFSNFILIFLRYVYLNMFMIFKYIKILSTPARRIFFNIKNLFKSFSYRNFSGLFLLSSSKGLITSTDALLKLHTAGEAFLKLFI